MSGAIILLLYMSVQCIYMAYHIRNVQYSRSLNRHITWNVPCIKVNIQIGKTVLLYVYPLHLKGTLSHNGHLGLTVLQLKEKGAFKRPYTTI